jgi:hypothetical protein
MSSTWHSEQDPHQSSWSPSWDVGAHATAIDHSDLLCDASPAASAIDVQDLDPPPRQIGHPSSPGAHLLPGLPQPQNLRSARAARAERKTRAGGKARHKVWGGVLGTVLEGDSPRIHRPRPSPLLKIACAGLRRRSCTSHDHSTSCPLVCWVWRLVCRVWRVVLWVWRTGFTVACSVSEAVDCNESRRRQSGEVSHETMGSSLTGNFLIRV